MNKTLIENGNWREQMSDTQLILRWLREANSLPGKSPTTMAIAILQLAERLQRSEHILLTPRGIQESGLNRTTAYRACCELVKAGLISVQRTKGSSPMVTLKVPKSE